MRVPHDAAAGEIHLQDVRAGCERRCGERERAVRYARDALVDNSGERASDGAHHVGKHAAGSRFKLTGLRIGF